MLLHCNGKLDEMIEVAGEAPVLSGEAKARADRALASRRRRSPRRARPRGRVSRR